MSLLRVQEAAQMPLVQFTEKLVDVTEIKQTGSRFRQFDSGEHSSCATRSITAWCRADREIQKAVDTTQVQLK